MCTRTGIAFSAPFFVVYLTILFSNVHYKASNERVIGKWWTGKNFEGNGHGLIRHYPCICL
jgi:hypothetical protein